MRIKELSLNEIKKLIPHREPMLLIDKVKVIKPFDSAVGVKKKQHRGLVWKFSGEAIVKGTKVADAIYSAMIVK